MVNAEPLFVQGSGHPYGGCPFFYILKLSYCEAVGVPLRIVGLQGSPVVFLVYVYGSPCKAYCSNCLLLSFYGDLGLLLGRL